MADFQDHDNLDFKHKLGGDALLGPNQEGEPMEGDTNSDCVILEKEDGDQPQSPAGPPPAEQEEQGLSSPYGLSQLCRDLFILTP